MKAANQCLTDGVEITEQTLSERMYAAHVCEHDPDLIIRTGGYSRLSGYLPWESIYSELYVTPTLFPDLSREEFAWACKWFSTIERTHGGQRADPAAKMQQVTEAAAQTAAPPFARKEETTNGQE